MAVSQEWVKRPERSTVGIIRLIVWFALTFGRRASRILLYPICLYFVAFSSKARNASRKYLSRALGRPAALRDIYRHYFYFASTILDRVFLLSGHNRLFDIRMHGAEIVNSITESQKGFF